MAGDVSARIKKKPGESNKKLGNGFAYVIKIAAPFPSVSESEDENDPRNHLRKFQVGFSLIFWVF